MGSVIKYFKLSGKYKLNRPLDDEEVRNQLFFQRDDGDTDANGSLLQFNSTYTEYVDNSFQQRGDAADIIGCLVFVILITISFYLFYLYCINFVEYSTPLIFLGCFSLLLSCFPYVTFVKREFFSYTHYPIRFNRKNRKIYVFRHNGEDGVLVVPWGEGFFHRGQSFKNKDVLNIRCHLMEGDLIKDTFDIGKPHFSYLPVDETWQFIWRYMEEGPKSVKPPFINLTTKGNWKSCWIISCARVFAISPILEVILFPIILPMTVMRWLGLNVCKQPVWPKWVEEECKIEPNDPHVLQEPSFIGEGFAEDTPETRAILEKYRKRRAEAFFDKTDKH